MIYRHVGRCMRAGSTKRASRGGARARRSRSLAVEPLEARRLLAAAEVASLAANPAVISDPNVGPGEFTLTVVYDQTMKTSVNPTIAFPTPGEDPLGAALTFGSGAWSTTTIQDDTYTATFDVADTGETIRDIDVRVTGAENPAAEVQVAYDQADVFSIDTENPTVTIAEVLPDPRTAVVADVPITFSEDVTGVDISDFTLTRNGIDVPGFSSVPLVAVSPGLYELDLSSVTAEGGAYVLTLVAAGSGIQDVAGNPLEVGDSDAWDMIVDLGTLAFLELAGQDPSAGILRYRLETSRAGYLTLEAGYAPAGGTAELTLLDANRSPIESSSSGTGEERIDHQAAAAGEVYFVELEGTNSDVGLRLANLVEHVGTTVTVYGTDEADAFRFDPAASRRVTINGIPYVFTDTQAQYVTFQAGAGNDGAVLYGAGLPDTAHLWPEHGTLNGQATQDGPAYAVTVESVESITVHGRDGADTAKLYDSAGVDTLVAKPDDARLYGTGFANRVTGFEEVHAYATAGADDVAKLYDSPGDDTFVATPDYGVLYGSGFARRAVGFRYVHAYSSGGTDVAGLHDDPAGDDTFVATPEYGVLYGSGFARRAVGFRYVHAYSSGGTDVAGLHDDPAGEDTFVATPDYGVLYGSGFANRAVGFRYVHGYSSGGTDVATLHDDAAGDDTFVATTDYAVLYNGGFANRAVGFRYVHAYSSGGTDVARLHDDPAGEDTFVATPDYGVLDGTGFASRAVGFRYVHAYSSGGTDEARLHDDPAGEDTFVATPDYGVLDGTGFAGRAVGFRYVHAYSSGGTDVGKLYDSAASQDTFVGTLDSSLLQNGTFFNRTVGFGDVHAYSRGGDDVAKLYDSPADDYLQAAANWARTSYGGSWIRVLGFARVVAISSLGGSDTKHVEATDYLLETLGPWIDVP